MELKIVKKENKTLIVETAGESVTFCNMIANELWEDKSTSEAAYIRDHPYLSQPRIFVKTSRGLPENALKKAASRLQKKIAEFGESFKKASKK